MVPHHDTLTAFVDGCELFAQAEKALFWIKPKYHSAGGCFVPIHAKSGPVMAGPPSRVNLMRIFKAWIYFVKRRSPVLVSDHDSPRVTCDLNLRAVRLQNDAFVAIVDRGCILSWDPSGFK